MKRERENSEKKKKKRLQNKVRMNDEVQQIGTEVKRRKKNVASREREVKRRRIKINVGMKTL